MARIFITGSSDGLGLMAARLLVDQGHQVVLHARHAQRAAQTQASLPQAEAVVIGDLSSIAQTRDLARQVNQLGRFDAIIHNAAVGYTEPSRLETEDGLSHVFAINALAPYLLTALIARPKRLVYLSSGLHRGAGAGLDDLNWMRRPWQGTQAYAESKFHNVLLAFAIARLWPEVIATALEPGWVPTKMGGPSAPDDLSQGHLTQAWLAGSDEVQIQASGRYFYHLRPRAADPATHDKALQQRFIDLCEDISHVSLPHSV